MTTELVDLPSFPTFVDRRCVGECLSRITTELRRERGGVDLLARHRAGEPGCRLASCSSQRQLGTRRSSGAAFATAHYRKSRDVECVVSTPPADRQDVGLAGIRLANPHLRRGRASPAHVASAGPTPGRPRLVRGRRGRADLLTVWPQGGHTRKFVVECKLQHERRNRERTVAEGVEQTGEMDRCGAEAGRVAASGAKVHVWGM